MRHVGLDLARIDPRLRAGGGPLAVALDTDDLPAAATVGDEHLLRRALALAACRIRTVHELAAQIALGSDREVGLRAECRPRREAHAIDAEVIRVDRLSERLVALAGEHDLGVAKPCPRRARPVVDHPARSVGEFEPCALKLLSARLGIDAND